MKSQTLFIITTPTTNLVPTIYYNNDDGTSTSFDRNIARIIPLEIESINEEKLHLDWTSFLPTAAVRTYYIHYTCLNNGDVQAMKVSKRYRYAVSRKNKIFKKNKIFVLLRSYIVYGQVLLMELWLWLLIKMVEFYTHQIKQRFK
jgi:hypothetical protein